MRFIAIAAIWAFVPVIALAAPTELELSKPAMLDGKSVPLHATVSATSSDILLSDTKLEGAVPVTITFYIAPKPKPPAATTTQAAATIQSSQGIQDSIASVSPGAAGVVAPVFTLVDGGRQKVADVVETQLNSIKKDLGADAGKVLGAEATKDAASNPMGTFWYILQTLYLYVLTVGLFLVSNAGVFYPIIAAAFLYALWRIFKRFRRH
jgi:hypothetical protein